MILVRLSNKVRYVVNVRGTGNKEVRVFVNVAAAGRTMVGTACRYARISEACQRDAAIQVRTSVKTMRC